VKNTTIAIDLAKSVFEIGISDRPGHVARNHRLSRTDLSAFLAAQPPATVVMEACSSAHYWGRTFEGFGHDVKLLPPFAVRPYVQRSKTDRTDVKGMLEAWRNSDIRPVPIKTESQQQLTSLHRVRSTWMAARTMRINSARGLLREFGVVFPAGAAALPDQVRALIEDADAAVPMLLRDLLHQLVLEIGELESRIKTVEKHLEALASQTPVVQRLRQLDRNILSRSCTITVRTDGRTGQTGAGVKPITRVATSGRCSDWLPARGFHHGPERYRSTPEAGDTTAV
jgi:transposase